jgi:hypothetical protein
MEVQSTDLVVRHDRASVVLSKIQNIKTRMVDQALELAELLSEARANSYHHDWGYENFGDWVENGSGLDLKERTAYYLISIIDKSRQLGITREDLGKSKISKLKEIFSLDADRHPNVIKQLVSASANISLESVRDAVAAIKTQDGQEALVYRTFSFTQSGYELTVKAAIERMMMEYGDTIDSVTKAPIDISPGRAIEMICADYLASPDPLLAEEIPVEEL